MSEGVMVSAIPSMRNAGDHFAGAASAPSGAGNLDLWGDDEFSFYDLLDLVNPLQHIPIVSNWYRSVTGDQIGAVARIFGGALLGGPIGAATAVINSAVESETGKDIGEHALALLNGEESFGDGEAPLVASMGDRSAELPFGDGTAGLRDRHYATGQNADAGGAGEIEGLPWLKVGSSEERPVLTASAGPLVVAREIGIDEALPWLARGTGPAPGASIAAAPAFPMVAEAEILPNRDEGSAGEMPDAPGPWVADAMMNALDKYGALARQPDKQSVDSSV